MTTPSAKAHKNGNDKSRSSSSTVTLPNGDAWHIDQSEGGLIGKGRFGEVRRCYRSSDGTAAACKIVTVPSDPFDAECVGSEVKAMQYLCATEASPHEALVRLHGVLALDSHQQEQQEQDYNDEDDEEEQEQEQEQGKERKNCNSKSEAEAEAVAVVMVMELCEGGDLFDRIAGNNAEGRVFSEREAARAMQQVMEGLAFCHARGVAHRDVKPDNILFVDAFSGRVKISDFGQAAFFRAGRGSMSGLVGTPYYVAPEIVEGQCEYTEKVDVWSAGVVLYMMLCGIPPFRGDSVHDIFRSILRGRLCFRSHMSASVRSLLRLMLQRHPSSRPSASHLLQHAWFLEHRHRIA